MSDQEYDFIAEAYWKEEKQPLGSVRPSNPKITPTQYENQWDEYLAETDERAVVDPDTPDQHLSPFD